MGIEPQDDESWEETLALLSDPAAMASLAEGIADIAAGRVYGEAEIHEIMRQRRVSLGGEAPTSP